MERGEFPPLPWVVQGAGHSLRLHCPQFFANLMAQTLVGWSIAPAQPGDGYDVTLSYDGMRYAIDSVMLDAPRDYGDMIDALNEVFLCLSYHVAANTPEAVLIHCAAFEQDRTCSLIIGRKGAGKSSLMFEKAVAGARIFADDLLVYFPAQARCMALGLPLRLRRPVPAPLRDILNVDGFFAGARLAYSKQGTYAVAPMGDSFLLDQIVALHGVGDQRVVPLRQSAAALAEYRIGAHYATLKKPRLLGPDA
jgi:hypothetical protein